MCIRCINAATLKYLQISNHSVTIAITPHHSPVFCTDTPCRKTISQVDNKVEFVNFQDFYETQPPSPIGVFTAIVINESCIDIGISSEEIEGSRSDKKGNVGIWEAFS